MRRKDNPFALTGKDVFMIVAFLFLMGVLIFEIVLPGLGVY